MAQQRLLILLKERVKVATEQLVTTKQKREKVNGFLKVPVTCRTRASLMVAGCLPFFAAFFSRVFPVCLPCACRAVAMSLRCNSHTRLAYFVVCYSRW